MNCAACRHPNPDGAKFCLECGAAMALRCGHCGTDLPPDAKFCLACGTRTGATGAVPAAPPVGGAGAPPSGARKTVTILFADLAGSTALHERLDAESTRRFMESYYSLARDAVESHGGTVTQLLGDGVKAVFGVPRVAEDDAIRAVRAAVAMQDAFHALAEVKSGALGETGLRIAVNTGEVVAEDESEIIGDPVNVAARLQEKAEDGDVVVGESTERLVGQQLTLDPLGSFALKGRAEAVKAYRVASLEAPAGASTAAFVGRDDELARIAAVYDRAAGRPGAHLAVLLGSPGLGKSRLIGEFTRRSAERATVMAAHCDAAGGATFAPLAEALQKLFGIEAGAAADTVRTQIVDALPGDDAERARIAEGITALLSGSPAPPEETFFVVRRLLAGLAVDRPVVLVVDDLQWAEPLLVDLVEHLIEWGDGVPLLVLVGARPELRDLRSSMVVADGLVSEVVTLQGLEAGVAMRLAANVIGAADLPAAVAAKVLATSEGNPLYIGELVRMLVHEGALVREGERWTAGTALETIEMPPTIHALLAARIERLDPAERTVLERAAVVGRHFSRSAVAELLPSDVPNLDARLESLRRSELVERDTGWLLGEPQLRFHHVLIRDAAYGRILKETRAELHERFADWVEGKAGDAPEHDETIGRHLERAHELLAALGPIDDAGRALGERAAARLAAAGRRALERDDVPLAANLLGRAVARLDPADTTRAELALDWCEALLAAGEVGPAAGAIDELGRFTSGSERLRAWHTCFAAERNVLTAPETLDEAAGAVEAAAASLASLADAAGEAKAHFVHALALARLGRVGACEAALDLALAAARRANDRRRANTVLAIAPRAALWGPSPVTRASGRCLDVVRVLRITQGSPAVEAVSLDCQGVLEALRGRTDAAHRMIASAREIVEELGVTQRLLQTDVYAGLVALFENDAPAAESSLRRAYEGLRDLGLGIDAAQAAALLARALLAQDRIEEAEALSHESEALAGDDLKAAIAWRGVRAEALARRGEHAPAIALATEAVGIAAATDALLDHADARLALAAALRAAGQEGEADTESRRARELWEKKGATILTERAAATPETGARGGTPAASRPRRRIRPNAATARHARNVDALDRRDFAAHRADFADDFFEVDHPTGSSWGLDEAMHSVESFFSRSREPVFESEPLASLGATLLLVRRRWSASGAVGLRHDVGAYENERIEVAEVDPRGLFRRCESFAYDRLADAIARLHERHAELLPEGVERQRAEATARAVAISGGLSRADPKTAFTPDFEAVDHRLLGTWGAEGGYEAVFRKHVGALREVAEDFAFRDEDVLGVEAGALLIRRSNTGTERVGGGAYENQALALMVFGNDGRAARYEYFDADREAEALARFDELTGWRDTGVRDPSDVPPPPTGAVRRIRPNAATAWHAGYVDAIARRDLTARRAGFSDDFLEVDHPTGSSWGLDEATRSLESFFSRSREPVFESEPLASLGATLLLVRRRWSASGAVGRRHDVGEYENERIEVAEVDPRGLLRRCESFAHDRLAGAIARLYERYAELLPEGPDRDGAAMTARAVAAAASFDADPHPAVFAPDVRWVDHRILGTWNARGLEAMREHARALLEVASDVKWRTDDVLGLEPGALLVRRTHVGTDRRSGGPYERRLHILFTFGGDGRMTGGEFFDVEREAEALARFEEVTGSVQPGSRVSRDELTTSAPDAIEGESPAPPAAFMNAPARLWKEQGAYARARDWSGYARFLDASFRFSDRRRLVQLELDKDGFVEMTRALGDMAEANVTVVNLATRGNRLGLWRLVMEVAGGDVGPSELEHLNLLETDERGELFVAHVRFDTDDLDAAYAELEARFLASDEASPAARNQHAFHNAIGQRDWDALRALCAPGFSFRDHRRLGWGNTLGGAAGLIEAQKALVELSPDAHYRTHHLRVAGDASFYHTSQFGTREGGAFENPYLGVTQVDETGHSLSIDVFDVDQLPAALARFEELAGSGESGGSATATDIPARSETSRRIRPNAASAAVEEAANALARRGAGAFRALYGEEFQEIHHPTGSTYGRDAAIASREALFRARDPYFRITLLATLGRSLSLSRRHTGASGLSTRRLDVGPYDDEKVQVNEVDERGLLRRIEVFASDRLGDAIVRLYERHAELLPEGPERERAAVTARAVAAAASFDAGRDSGLFAPDVSWVDHRTLGTWNERGLEAMQEHVRALREVASDVEWRTVDVLALEPGAFLVRRTHLGVDRRSGGPYERHFLILNTFRDDGRMTGAEFFDVDREAEALVRFEEITGSAATASGARADPPPAPFLNAAVRRFGEQSPFYTARDWAGYSGFFAPDFRFSDRRRLTQVDLDRDGFVEMVRALGDMDSRNATASCLATRGVRLALWRLHLEVSGGDVGPSDLEHLNLFETDERGERFVARVRFDADDLDAAYAELDARYAAGEGGAHPALETQGRLLDALARRDWEALRAEILSEHFRFEDHRLLGWGTTLEDAAGFIESQKVLVELAPDAGYRLDHLRVAGRKYFNQCVQRGTREGGAFETPVVTVVSCDASGRIERMDTYDMDQLDRALARFEALRGGEAGRTSADEAWAQVAKPNAANAWCARSMAAGSLGEVRALCEPDAICEDRQRHSWVSGDPELMIASIRTRIESGSRLERAELLATAGDRIALHRFLWAGGPPDGRFETELIALHEVNEAGRLTGYVGFDADAFRAAQREAWKRWIAMDPTVAETLELASRLLDTPLAERRRRSREFTDDFVVEDHRLAGMGRIEGGQAYLDSLDALRSLTDAIHLEAGAYWPAIGRRGGVMTVRLTGDVRGGGPFERDYLNVFLHEDRRWKRVEFFEIEKLTEALARFDELHAAAEAT